MTRYVCRTLGIAIEELNRGVVDGDQLLLVWRDANSFSRASVESQALALGLDVLVVVAPGYQQEVTKALGQVVKGLLVF